MHQLEQRTRRCPTAREARYLLVLYGFSQVSRLIGLG